MSSKKPITPPEPISYEEYTQKVNKLKTMSDVTNFAKELIGPTLQAMFEAEMTDHLGYDKHSIKGNNSGNSRNGHFQKSVKTSFGEEKLDIPRDRKGEYEPLAVKKYQTVESDVEEKIISMYAKGMTTSDINDYLNDIYGISVSNTMVSNITDKVIPLITEWQARPLDNLYVIIYLDGIHFKVRDNGRIVNKCGYTVLGITREGQKELLGIWIGESEGSKFWLKVLNEIQSRGVKDIIIASVDGLAGFKDAINTVFPDCQVQQCLVHQVRNTIKYVAHKHRKEFCQDLKTIYRAPTEEAGLQALEDIKQKWPDYALYLKRWEDKWDQLSVFFQYAEPIRRIIYTNNTVESLHRQFRKVTKTTSMFPHEEALVKLLWLAQRDLSRKWTLPIQNWGEIISQLTILFPDRIKL
ncbi:MAG: IS256 family transposase [Candidatus Komeilibacteria bacterium]